MGYAYSKHRSYKKINLLNAHFGCLNRLVKKAKRCQIGATSRRIASQVTIYIFK